MQTLFNFARRGLLAVVVFAAAAAPPDSPGLPAADGVAVVPTAVVVARLSMRRAAYEGVVEAMRESVIAAQVSGAVVALHVRAGDRVQAGQVLVRIDARAADQTAVAGAAHARAGRAALEVATRDFERQQQLFAQGFISRAALDRADAQFKTAQAEASAEGANAGAARTQSELHVVKAPYGGVVANVSVVLGEMATPGRPLLTLYDPAAMRVTAAVPQSAVATMTGPLVSGVEIPGRTADLLRPLRVQRLPTVDAASHTLELRMDLPDGTDVAPGMFARVWLLDRTGGAGAGEPRLFVPSQALLRRAEFSAVYVVGPEGKPALRQVRAGRGDGDEVEILSGVAVGERVALDPLTASRVR